MILISCVDNALGMRFHGRRQSRDRELCRRVLERCGGRLWLGEKSAMLFEGFPEAELCVTEDPARVPEGAYCFWEEPVEEGLTPERIYLYGWNRDYPAEEYFRFPGGRDAWEERERADFPGYSHPAITETRFEKRKQDDKTEE